MAVDDLDILRQEVPELFKDQVLPSGWEDDWIFVPVEDVEGVEPQSELERDWPTDANSFEGEPTAGLTAGITAPLPRFGEAEQFGGNTVMRGPAHLPPPPDALAFYLPFHYFHPNWWGVYLVREGVLELADWLRRYSQEKLSPLEAELAARIFLYSHEAFHHAVEAFATRLEITHRTPVYRAGFEKLFRRVVGTDECVEEALACAFAYQKLDKKMFRKPNDPLKRAKLLQATEEYIGSLGPGYRRGVRFLKPAAFQRERSRFGEMNHSESFGVPFRDGRLWNGFPHAFGGISRVTSRVNYIVRRNSALARRLRLDSRFLRYRELRDRLERAKCRLVRQGRGSHEIWEAPNGARFPVPRHARDLDVGLLASIIKQAGLEMSVSEFMSS